MGLASKFMVLSCWVLLSSGVPAAEIMAHFSGEPEDKNKTPSLLLVRELLSDVHSERQQVVSVELAGRVISSRIVMGTAVERGGVLLQLDDREAVARQQQAQADVDKIQAQLSYQRTQYQRAEKNLSRGVIAKVEMEKLQSQVLQSSAELERAKAQLNIAKIVVSKHKIQAPFSGVLQRATPYWGEWIEAGEAATVILDYQHLSVHLQLAPDEAIAIKQGLLLVAPLTDPRKPMMIKQIAPAADASSGMVKVELSLLPTLKVIPGQSLYLGLYRSDEMGTDFSEGKVVTR